MAIMVICRDGPNATALRKHHLADHLSYIDSILEHVLIAGPTRSRANPQANTDSSVFIYATDDVKQARHLFSEDPYAANGVYIEVEYCHFTPAAGSWIGGKIW